MERDFLGLKGKDSEDSKGNRQNSDFVGGSPTQWSFSNKVTAFQQLASFKAVRDEKPTKIAFDHHSMSGFQPVNPAECFDSNKKISPVQQAQQKCFNLDRQATHQFAMPTYQPQCPDPFGTSALNVVSHHSIPVATSSPFFKVYGPTSSSNLQMISSKQQSFGAIGANNVPTMASGVGNLIPRNVSEPSVGSSQLTIFYGGSVNVYDDVPVEKAQAVMFMASKWCNANSNALSQRPHPAVPAVAPKVSGVDSMTMSQIPTWTQTQNLVSTPIVSSPISVTSHVGAHSRCGSTNTDEVARMKGKGQVPPSPSQHEPIRAVTISAPMLPRAVPQARKASLARFLEKRKERVTNAMPYFSAQKSPEDYSGGEAASVVSKSSSADISRSSNQESWSLGQYRNSNSGVSPSNYKQGM